MFAYNGQLTLHYFPTAYDLQVVVVLLLNAPIKYILVSILSRTGMDKYDSSSLTDVCPHVLATCSLRSLFKVDELKRKLQTIPLHPSVVYARAAYQLCHCVFATAATHSFAMCVTSLQIGNNVKFRHFA